MNLAVYHAAQNINSGDVDAGLDRERDGSNTSKFTVLYTEPTRVVDLTPRNTGVRATDLDEDVAVSTTARQIECDKVIFATGSNRFLLS